MDENNNKIAKFLEKIKMLESSGGINTNHETMESGIHKGQSAYGSYGLMPNTIQELVNRKRLETGLDPDYESLNNNNPDAIKAILKQKPDIEERLAQQLAERLLNKNLEDEKAAYGWKMGHNIPADKITPEKLNSNEYVNRFRSLKNRITSK